MPSSHESLWKISWDVVQNLATRIWVDLNSIYQKIRLFQCNSIIWLTDRHTIVRKKWSERRVYMTWKNLIYSFAKREREREGRARERERERERRIRNRFQIYLCKKFFWSEMFRKKEVIFFCFRLTIFVHLDWNSFYILKNYFQQSFLICLFRLTLNFYIKRVCYKNHEISYQSAEEFLFLDMKHRLSQKINNSWNIAKILYCKSKKSLSVLHKKICWNNYNHWISNNRKQIRDHITQEKKRWEKSR